MSDILIITLFASFATYAIIKWWFDTSLMDHVTQAITFNDLKTFVELKQGLEIRSPRVGAFFVELFECPWCLSFHISLWVNVFVFATTDVHTPATLALSVIASAGGGMKLYSGDSNES